MARRPLPASPTMSPLLLATALLAGCSLATIPPAPRTGDTLVLHGAARSQGPASLRVRDRQYAATAADDDDDTPLPLVIWHGLGDSFAGEGIQDVTALADAIHPGTFVHTVALGQDAAADRYATWYGNLTEQVQTVCDAIATHPILSTAPAIDALGFSQGGQFLRAYVERCNSPPVRSLVTFGSQHNGIVEFRACAASDWLCRGAMLLLRYSTWSSFVQGRLVPAQYFRDPADLQPYLDHSNFLADINNERGPASRNGTYRRNLARLANFVLYMFDADTTVVPRETSWFAEVNGTDVVPLRKRQLYRDDWLGLRQLDSKGRLFFRSLPGDHMDIPLQTLKDTIVEFFGPSKRTFATSGAEFETDEL